MPISVERLPGEPIIVAKLSGVITPELIVPFFEECTRLAETIEGRVYRISDVSQVQISYSDLMQVLASSIGTPGSSLDPRFYVLMVGPHAWLQLYTDSLKQHGSAFVPIFDSLDDALAYVREHL
jgi:hypothetical protein